MSEGAEWRWQFLGYESSAEGQPVQEWFDGLPEEAQEEIRDLVRYLEKTTSGKWRRPEFDPLIGDCGISELRPCDVQIEENGKVRTLTCRIYGFFGPQSCVHSYTLLYGTGKRVRNDKNGKRIACGQLERVRRGEAGVHRFRFQRSRDPTVA
jgi:hypothetical protein